jgi:hypothetical protein
VNLLAQAEADNSFILEDAVNGFGRAMTYTSPDVVPVVIVLVGQVIRRGTKLDQATGLPVAGDEASVTFRLSTFQADNPGLLPVVGGKIATTDSTGAALNYRIPADGIMLDRTAGRCTITNLKLVAS